MSNTVLNKYRGVVIPLNDSETTDGMLRILVDMTPQEQQRMWIKSENIGHVCLFKHDNFPGKALEYVMGSQEDSITTLYEGTPVMADMMRLEELREELIAEIARVLMALPSTVAVYDAGRERQATLKELGTAQLIDTLAHFTHTDLATV